MRNGAGAGVAGAEDGAAGAADGMVGAGAVPGSVLVLALVLAMGSTDLQARTTATAMAMATRMGTGTGTPASTAILRDTTAPTTTRTGDNRKRILVRALSSARVARGSPCLEAKSPFETATQGSFTPRLCQIGHGAGP